MLKILFLALFFTAFLSKGKAHTDKIGTWLLPQSDEFYYELKDQHNRFNPGVEAMDPELSEVEDLGSESVQDIVLGTGKRGMNFSPDGVDGRMNVAPHKVDRRMNVYNNNVPMDPNTDKISKMICSRLKFKAVSNFEKYYPLIQKLC